MGAATKNRIQLLVLLIVLRLIKDLMREQPTGQTQDYQPTGNDSESHKSEKPRIGTSEKNRPIEDRQNQPSPRKRIGECRLDLRRLHQRQQLAYFVPDLIDVLGTECQPPTQVGANYVDGRGSFSSGSPSWGIPNGTNGPFADEGLQGDGYVEPMWFEAKWTANMNAFKDGEGCCCCDEISWSQILKEKKKWGGVMGIFLGGTGRWTFDSGHVDYIHGGDGGAPAIGTVGSGNPCKVFALEIGMADQPFQSNGNRLLGRLLEYTMKFEACVYCRSGIEGPVVISEMGWAHDSMYRKLVVYGCARWGFSAKRQKDGTYKVTYTKSTVVRPDFAAWKEASTTHYPNRPERSRAYPKHKPDREKQGNQNNKWDPT